MGDCGSKIVGGGRLGVKNCGRWEIGVQICGRWEIGTPVSPPSYWCRPRVVKRAVWCLLACVLGDGRMLCYGIKRVVHRYSVKLRDISDFMLLCDRSWV